MKLLMQELMAINVQMRITSSITESNNICDSVYIRTTHNITNATTTTATTTTTHKSWEEPKYIKNLLEWRWDWGWERKTQLIADTDTDTDTDSW